jgi:LPS sulfotransferase NodH
VSGYSTPGSDTDLVNTRLQKAVDNPSQAVDFLRQQLFELWRQPFKLVGQRDYKKFILLGRIRTGSNMLRSFLNSHPNIFVRPEIFKTLGGRDYRQILNGTFCRQPGRIKAVGFKLFYGHPYDDKSGRLWNELISKQELYIVHLKRRNILRAFLSQKIALKTNVWENTGTKRLQNIDSRMVKFTVAELREEFETIKRLEQKFDQRFGQHPILVVYYEDLVSNPQEEFHRITDFLNLPFYPPKTWHTRQNPETLPQLISNYEQLKKEFSGTEWEDFFEEDVSIPSTPRV